MYDLLGTLMPRYKILVFIIHIIIILNCLRRLVLGYSLMNMNNTGLGTVVYVKTDPTLVRVGDPTLLLN